MNGFAKRSKKSPWASINDVLIQNKCWLCETTFPKDRQKHVFEVSNLLTFYHNQLQRDLASGTGETTKFTSPNLQTCYESYVQLMNEGEGKPDKLFEEFKGNDVEVWMSGLVCGGSPECRQELSYFIEPKAHGQAAGEASSDRKKVHEMFSFAIPKGGDSCPPGCNCEPTWPFMP